MQYEPEQVVVRWFVELIRKRIVWIILGLLAAWAFLLRCLHLLNPDRYYLLGADSHFFHWLAGRVMSGEEPPPDMRPEAIYTLQSGLAYPLAFIAKTVSYLSDVSYAESLDLVAKFLPPFLGVISLIVIYLIAAKIYDRKTGFFSALSWALMLQAIFLGGGGLIDRDGLSAFLIMLGALVFYLSRDWHLYLRGRDVGWFVAGLGVLLIEGLLYLEWSFVGSALLIALVSVYFIVKFLIGFAIRVNTDLDTKSKAFAALRETEWRTFVIVIACNALVAVALYPQVSSWFGFLSDLFGYGRESPVSELHGIGFRDLTVYHFFLIPMIAGLYFAWKRRSNSTIFFVCWFLFYLLLSVFAKRILFFAAPAACLLSGLGLTFIWDWAKEQQPHFLRRFAMVALVLLILLVSFITAASIGSDPVMSVNKDWQGALMYLREETPKDSIVMAQWSWGYWILDPGERTPIVDNGFYGYPIDKLHDIGLAYVATDPSEAARIMEKYDADYLIFSTLDLDVAKHIIGWAWGVEGQESFSADSLIVRSLNGDFVSGDELEVVFRSADSEVVILKRI